MSIGLFCYVAEPVSTVDSVLSEARAQHEDLFASKFLISSAREATAMHKEIASEYGVEAQTFFLVTLNEKKSADLITSVANLFRKMLFKNSVLILLENESPV